VRLVIVKKITTYILYGLPKHQVTSENLLPNEIVKTELISDKELQNFKTSTRINT
jgi:hypothetical protein